MLRRHLEELGHGFKLAEIKEALDILSGTMIELSPSDEHEPVSQKGKHTNRRRHFIKATILSNYAGAFEEADTTGEESRAAMMFHPLATQAILELATSRSITPAWVHSSVPSPAVKARREQPGGGPEQGTPDRSKARL
jgi:hypothetical protein